MAPSVQNLIESRLSIHHFQPHRSLDESTITALAGLATKAPSAYNLQNWRFIAVRSEEAKSKLKSAAYGQQKVVDASVTFILCGTLAAHTQLAAALKPSVDADIMEQGMVEAWVAQASRSYDGNAQLQRDEALRSASLAAMTLMLAAEGMGLVSCAMSGFDTEKVKDAFGLTADELPVMLVAVGYAGQGNGPQKARRSLADVLTIV